jgi:hypothetical protein
MHERAKLKKERRKSPQKTKTTIKKRVYCHLHAENNLGSVGQIY